MTRPKLAEIHALMSSFKVELTTGSFPAFLIPHTTVPACLSGLAFWQANKNHGNNIDLSSQASLLIGSLAGGLFGISSAGTFYRDRNLMRQTIIHNIDSIKQHIDTNAATLSTEKIELIHRLLFQGNKTPQLSSSAYLANAFAIFTTAITSYAYSSLFYFISDDEQADTPSPRWLLGIMLATTLSLTEMLFAHKGQQQAHRLKAMLLATETVKIILCPDTRENTQTHTDSALEMMNKVR